MEKCLCINFLPKLSQSMEVRAIYQSKLENTDIEFKEWVDMDTYKEWLEEGNYKVVLFDYYKFDYLEDLYKFMCISDNFNIRSLYCLSTYFEVLDGNLYIAEVINFLTNGGI
ncbi:hypothetical protein Q75_02910 [Bacillus coahuilensis p1.1.43]|uniref:Uncharacterized protein n=1 Tax=Bacillus coahuilensis p1.1.43 TaxID=1150625 RepID=A0A147KBC3_9BACI|nr:hypothetical protein [Bacillus coahuilensis]KUP08430.1 hypothetical protein Q75_02910 [Bacillus coahuilensis p1.1.43]